MLHSTTAVQRRALLAAAALMFAYGLSNNTLAFFLEPVTEAIGCSRASFNLYYTIMSIVSMVVSPVFGQLLQKTDIRKILSVGALVGAGCFVAFSFCRTIPMFYVVALVLGLVQSGATSVCAVVIINRAYDGTGGGGQATGLAMAGTGICSVVMSLILPNFIGALGWQMGYLLQAVIWAVMVLLAVFLVGAQSREGDGVQAGATAAEVFGATFAQTLRSPRLYIVLACVVVLNICMIFVQHMPAFFTEKGMSDATSGMIMSVFSVFLIICKIGLGSLFDKLGAVRTVIVAFACYAVGLWVMSFGGLVPLCVGSAFSAFGMASSTVLTPLVTKNIFGTREYAPIWGLVSMATAMGAAVGSPTWGAVYDAMQSYTIAVFIAPVFVLCDGAILALMMSKKARWG